MIAAVFAVVLLASTPVDCPTIRQHVAEHGKAKAIIWARQQGYSWADIWRVRKQCRV